MPIEGNCGDVIDLLKSCWASSQHDFMSHCIALNGALLLRRTGNCRVFSWLIGNHPGPAIQHPTQRSSSFGVYAGSCFCFLLHLALGLAFLIGFAATLSQEGNLGWQHLLCCVILAS
jgi:hypothetical protein